MPTNIIERSELLPGDIVLSLGEIDPGKTNYQLRLDFERYNPRALSELRALLRPVMYAQMCAGIFGSGSSKMVHAGLCTGTLDGEPVITDLFGTIQDTKVSDYYLATTLRVYRPDLPKGIFVKAQKSLYDKQPDAEKKRWAGFAMGSEIYFPGRMNAFWDTSIVHALSIILTPSSLISSEFLFCMNNTLSELDSKQICSKAVIQIYKLVLQEMGDSYVLEYMNLLDSTSPKNLHSYLRSNSHYAEFTIPTEPSPFFRIKVYLEKHRKCENYSQLWGIYVSTSKLEDKSEYEKAEIFAKSVAKKGYEVPRVILAFFKSQDIEFGEYIAPIEVRTFGYEY